MSTNNKPQAGKPAAGRPFVVPDRKVQAQAPNNKPKPTYNNSKGNYNNKPKFVPPKVEKAAWSRPFIVPDRKQQVQAAKVTNDATAKSSNGKFNASQGKKTWWENHDSVDTLELIKFEEGQAWHTLLPAYLNETDGHNVKLSGDKLVLATKLIDVAYQKQMKLYTETLKNSTEMKGDLKWMNDMIKSGTMSDKVAAMALKVQGSPFHELDTLDTLIGMALKKEQRSAQLAIEALKDLFVNNLLPERQLRTLEHNMFSHASMTLHTALLVWFESQLKTRYEKVLEALDNGLKSNVDFFKRECLQTISELLIGKPEQEARLLSMLVNKLGDPSRATCSKAIEALKQVVRSHPAMKIVVVREVRQFLYRPNLKIRPIFNGIILLSNVQLNKGDHAVAVQLVEGYLSLFEKTMKEEEYGSRLLSALLTGINKALPFLDNTESLGKYVDPLFRIVHTASSFSTATQALMLLSHLALSIGNEQQARKGKHAADTEKAEKKGEETEEAQIIKRYYRALYAKLLSDQITTRSRNTLFLNLLYRSIKGDPLHHRAVAFLKRLLICAAQSVPPIAAGLLFLVSEIVRARPTLKECLANVPEQIAVTASGEPKEVGEDGGYLGNFNVLKREPEFAYAPDAQPSVWEIALLRRHFHPSVANFATSLLDGPEHHIEFGGDPTVEFSLMAFLNRFAYKNPKKNTTDRIKHRTAASEEPVNLTLTHKDSTEVDPDQQFFHKYFSDKQQLVAEGRSRNRSKRATEESDNENSDDEGNDSDPEEAAIDRYATKLAEEMMRSADGNRDEEDLNFSDEDDSDDGSAVMGPDDEAEGGADNDSDSEDGQDFDQGLVVESDSESDEEEEEQQQSRKKVAKKIAKITGVTSDALDFADFVAEQEKKNKTSSKAKKGKKSADADDSSDDGYGLEAYGDDDNEEVEEGYDGFDDDSLEASDVEIPESGDEEDEDEDDDSEEYDSQESDGGMEFDESDDEALEDAGLFDSDSESNNKAKSAKKGKKFEKKAPTSKRSRGSDSDFASAEDYEDMMEEILQSVNKTGKEEPVVAAKNGKDAKMDAKMDAKKDGKKDVKDNKKAAPAPVAENKKRKETPPPVSSKPAAGKANNSKKQKKI